MIGIVMMHKFVFATIMLLIATRVYAQEPFKSISFNEAGTLAQKEHKVIIIDFYTTWCGPCKLLDKTTWQDKDVTKFLNDNSISLKIDAEAQADLAHQFHIHGYPTILFIKPDGSELDRFVGYLNPERFLAAAKSTLAGKDSLAVSKEVLANNSNDLNLRIAYTNILINKSLYKEAIEQYQIILVMTKNDIERRQEYADLLRQAGQNKEAIAEYQAMLVDEHKNDPYLRMSYADVLAQNSQYKDALAEYIWCYDHGTEYDPSFISVQGVSLLNQIIKLSDKYPQAKQALVEHRDLLQQTILTSKATSMQIRNFGDLNNCLKDLQNTLEVFDKVKPPSNTREQLLKFIINNLLQAKRYKDILETVTDPLAKVDKHLQGTLSMLKMIHYSPDIDKNAIIETEEATKQHTIKINSAYYEALLGIKDLPLATKVADSLINFYNNTYTYNTLIECAKRTNATEIAKQLEQQAANLQPKKD